MHKTSFKDITGQKFGHLTALRIDTLRTTKKHTYWICQCTCGRTRTLQLHQLTSEKVTSCGCQNTKVKKGTVISKDKRLYSLYSSMVARCTNPNAISYKFYGAKGITVCDEWRNDYKNFYDWAVSSGYKDGLSIDRIDNAKGYSPNNCRWVTFHEQVNHKENSVYYSHNGETHTMAEWCAILDFSYTLAKSRRKAAKKHGTEPTFEYVFAPKQKRGRKKSVVG